MKTRFGLTVEIPGTQNQDGYGSWEKADLELEEHDIDALCNMDGWSTQDRAQYAALATEQLVLAGLCERHPALLSQYRERLTSVTKQLQVLRTQQ